MRSEQGVLRPGTLRGLLLASLAALAAPAVGCAHANPVGPTDLPGPGPVDDLDDFEQGLNDFVLLGDEHPKREAYRQALLGFLETYLSRAVKDGDEDEAYTSLRYALSLYSPAELRRAAPRPGLAKAAHALYRQVASHGAERPALLALAVEQRFGEKETRDKALEDWEALETWLIRNGPYADEPLLKHEELERALEDVAAIFPSPFVTQRLADLYVARYEAAVRSKAHGRGFGTASVRRIEITGYLLMRLYLRADDLDAAVSGLNRVELDPPVAKLREILEDATKPRRNARALVAIAEQFVPEPGADPDLPYVVQGWGIVDNLARRALQRHPKDPYVHLLRARTLVEAGLVDAAIFHLRKTIDLKEDVFEAWAQLAQLEHRSLSRLAESDPEEALERIATLEAFHRRAVELWRDRPIRPGLPDAYYVVAEGLYQAGRVDSAIELLGRSQTLQPRPQTLDLLGTIALKRAHWGDAEGHFDDLATLAFDSELAQLQWEARARHQLGLIAMRRGDNTASAKHFKLALRHTNELLARGETDAARRSDRYVERGKLLFLLGDVRLAMNDFDHAADLAPDSVKVYADPLLLMVSYGHHDEARRIFRRAMAHGDLANSLKLYFSLWMNELAQVQGESPDPEATAFLRGYDEDDWGSKLARHARGDLAFDELLDDAKDKGRRAEAFFYEGVRRWRSGDADRGRELLESVVKTEMMGFFEYDMAQAFLRRGGPPTHPVRPLPRGVATQATP